MGCNTIHNVYSGRAVGGKCDPHLMASSRPCLVTQASTRERKSSEETSSAVAKSSTMLSCSDCKMSRVSSSSICPSWERQQRHQWANQQSLSTPQHPHVGMVSQQRQSSGCSNSGHSRMGVAGDSDGDASGGRQRRGGAALLACSSSGACSPRTAASRTARAPARSVDKLWSIVRQPSRMVTTMLFST